MSLALYRPSPRAIAAIGVLAAWAASLGWLGARQLDQDEATTLSMTSSLRLAPIGAWYAIYAGGVQVGTASITLDTLSPGYRIVESSTMETPVGAKLLRATWRTETHLGPGLELEGLRAKFGRPGRPIDWTVAAVAESLTAHSTTHGVQAGGRVHLAANANPTAGAALTYRLAMGGSLAPGRSRTLFVLDGWPLGARQTAIAVSNDSTAVFADSSRIDPATGNWISARVQSVRVADVTVDGVDGPYRLWVDHRGGILGMETALGLHWTRTDFDLAVSNFRHLAASDSDAIRQAFPVIRTLAERAGPRDSSVGERRFLATHRDGTPVDTALLAKLGGGRQQVHGDTIVIEPDARTTLVRPPAVSPDPAIQSEAAALATFAKRFSGMPLNESTFGLMIAATHRAVQVDTNGLAAEDALGTFAAHRGRPDGVARLLVAVARAAGMTARYVIGVAPRGDTLYTQAWVEVWSPNLGGWFAVDPVSNSARASTGLIRLAYGGSSYPEDMLPLLANARLMEITARTSP